MPEWAILLTRAADLHDLDTRLTLEPTCTGRLREWQREARDAVREAFGPARFSRLYFGNEFCERLAPLPHEAVAAYEAAARRDMRFSLLTSYVTNAGLDRYIRLFERLAALPGDTLEVIVNDWGLLRLLRRDFPTLRLVLGRLMNRMLRDPRIAGAFASARAPDAALSALRQSAVSAPVYRRFLERHGVEMVEFDNVIQGLDMDFRELGIAGSIYLPYGYIATGRVCMIGSLGRSSREAFDVASACHRECQLYTLRFEYSDSPFGNRDQEFIQRGNTYFYHQGHDDILSAARMVERLGIARIVFQPELPM